MDLKTGILIAALSAAVVTPVSVQAGSWGRGPSFGGYHPFSQPIPRKPLAGAQIAAGDVQKAAVKAGTDVWDATKRPFVETAKFLKDPLAGPKWAMNDAIDKAKAIATPLGWQMVVWLSVGFGAAMTVAMLIDMGVAPACAMSAHGPTRHAPTARPNASFRPRSASGSTPSPTAHR